jgi:hypothetical protein
VRCEGLPVDSPQGRVGVVAYLRYRRRHDRPDFLVVRTGRLPGRLAVVPVELVEDVDATAGRVLLRAAPVPEREPPVCSPAFAGRCGIWHGRRSVSKGHSAERRAGCRAQMRDRHPFARPIASGRTPP